MATRDYPSPAGRPRIGIPWRSLKEENAGRREKLEPYLRAVEAAGGEAVPISLRESPEELARLAEDFDGFVLPGSSADVDPKRYGAGRGAYTAEADPARERADYALLDHAFREHKPVLAICYGTQLLNVYRGGTLVQDIRSEVRDALEHPWQREAGRPEPHHAAQIISGTRLELLAERREAEVNSSHHQSVREPGEGLRIVARSPDGVVEAIEWTGENDWVLGVQWHPERQWPEASSPAAPSGVALAHALFEALVKAARTAPTARAAAGGQRSPAVISGQSS